MKLLVLLSRFPYPLEKGDKLRAYHQLKILAETNDIYLIALNDKKLKQEDIIQVQSFCKELHIINLNWWSKIIHIFIFFFRGLPLQCGYFYSRKAQCKINAIIKEVAPDRIFAQLIRVAEYVKRSSINKTLDYQDVLSKGIYRRYEVAPFWLKPFFHMEYKRLKKYEAKIFSYFDQHTIITGVDRDLISHSGYQKIEVIPNGVDFDTFSYKGEEKKYDLIFTGNMSYAPNVNAAEYLAKHIFPLIQSEIPGIKLVICGAQPTHRIKNLANKDIIVTGWVNSIAEYYAQSKIFIAPMQLGTGLQNKLLEAMAMGLPCITSSLAGKPLQNIIPGKEIMICNTVTGYVDAVIRLLANPTLYQDIAQQGHLYVKKNYNWENTTLKLEEIIKRS